MCNKAISTKHYTCSPFDIRSQNMFNFSVSFHQENDKKFEYNCVQWQSQKTLSGRVHSHVIPGQGIGPASPKHHCIRSKSSFIPTNHQTWDFQLLIPHKQNPHTEINQLAVTSKIFSQHGIQLWVASVPFSHGKQTVMGCMKDSLGLFNIQVSFELWSYLWLPEIRKIFQLHYSTVNQRPSQTTCKSLAAGDIVLCLHAV